MTRNIILLLLSCLIYFSCNKKDTIKQYPVTNSIPTNDSIKYPISYLIAGYYKYIELWRDEGTTYSFIKIDTSKITFYSTDSASCYFPKQEHVLDEEVKNIHLIDSNYLITVGDTSAPFSWDKGSAFVTLKIKDGNVYYNRQYYDGCAEMLRKITIDGKIIWK